MGKGIADRSARLSNASLNLLEAVTVVPGQNGFMMRGGGEGKLVGGIVSFILSHTGSVSTTHGSIPLTKRQG